METKREKIVAQAQAWLGLQESDNSHREVIDVYNGHFPRARNYKLKYTDPWCAGFVSACAIACGAADSVPTEVSCSKMVQLMKNMGIWVESDSYVPQPGDILFYDWQDTGRGDCTGSPDHVGIVEKVTGSTVTVIEGNYKNAVKRRKLQVNGRYIRGYGVPRYGQEAVTVCLPVLCRGRKGAGVRPLQSLLCCLGYDLGERPVDGSFGPRTQAAVLEFQTDRQLPQTGQADEGVWLHLLELA